MGPIFKTISGVPEVRKFIGSPVQRMLRNNPLNAGIAAITLKPHQTIIETV
jgi:hypothetical protein